MDKHYRKQQNDRIQNQNEFTPIDFIKIKHMNRLKNRKNKNTANNFNTLGRSRNLKTIFDGII